MILKKSSYKLLLLAILFTLITDFLSISFQKINSIFNLQLFDIENIINEHLTDVASYEYERRYPYKSRGLSMEDFL